MKNPTSCGAEVVIVTRNSADCIGACIRSVLACGALPVVVDNGSNDGTVDIVRSICSDALIVQTGQNLGYGKAMNLGFQKTTGEFVILSNADVVFLDDSIGSLTKYLEKNTQVAVVGPQQVYPDGSWQRSYGDLPGIWSGVKDAIGITTLQNTIRRMLWPQEVDRNPKRVPYLDGAVLAVRRALFLQVGGFDEAFFFYSEECDLCARFGNMGWKVVFLPSARVVHVRGADKSGSGPIAPYLVSSQYLLARKHLSERKARAYAKLQVAHYGRLAAIHRLMYAVQRKNSASVGKIRMFETLSTMWRNPNDQGTVAEAGTSGSIDSLPPRVLPPY